MAVLHSQLGLIRRLRLRALPANPTTTAATAAPATGSLLELLLAFAALFAWLALGFGCRAARRRRRSLGHRWPLGAILLALPTPAPATSALGPLLAAAALLLGIRSKFFRVFLFLQEVGDVQKGVALQPQFDKCRLHAGKHTRYFAFVNGSGERVLILALVIDLGELIVLNNRKPRLMRRRRNTNLFRHAASFLPAAHRPGQQTRQIRTGRVLSPELRTGVPGRGPDKTSAD